MATSRCQCQLKIVINDRLSATDHVNAVLSSCSGLLDALRILHSHGMPSHLYMMYFGQPSSPRFYMVHHRGLVCVLPLIVPDSTRSFAGVSATTTVPMTFQLLKICSLTLTIHYLNSLSITQRTSYTPSFPRNLNNHTTCEKGYTTTLLSRRLPNWTNVTTLRIFCTKTAISSLLIFHSFYIRCCVSYTSLRFHQIFIWAFVKFRIDA